MRLLALLLLVAPVAQAATLGMQLTQERETALLGEELPFQLRLLADCRSPPASNYAVELHEQRTNVFAWHFQRRHWNLTATECAQGPRTLTTQGFLIFNANASILEPFRVQEIRLDAWLTVGEEVRAFNTTYLRAAPDYHFAIGATLAPPGDVQREGNRLVQEQTWTITNHGTGTFRANLTVHDKPAWLTVELPATVEAQRHGRGSQAIVAMRATMPAACPQAAATVILGIQATATEERSRASDERRVQGQVPCRSDLAKGTPLHFVAAAALIVAALAAARQHKR